MSKLINGIEKEIEGGTREIESWNRNLEQRTKTDPNFGLSVQSCTKNEPLELKWT